MNGGGWRAEARLNSAKIPLPGNVLNRDVFVFITFFFKYDGFLRLNTRAFMMSYAGVARDVFLSRFFGNWAFKR